MPQWAHTPRALISVVLWGEGRNITAVSLVAECTYTLCATNPVSEIITVTGKNKCDTKHEGYGGCVCGEISDQ